MISKTKKIFITGHNGMVGSACLKYLKEKYYNLITVSSKELDLRNQELVYDFIEKNRPDIIIHAAGKVGGILSNKNYPYEYLYDNLQMQNNLIHGAFKFDVEKFIFMSSSCIYPKYSKQPIREEYLLSGPLEETNQWFALAKISGLKLIEALRTQYGKNYLTLMSTNLYGPGDNYDLQNSHVLPALIRKFHEAKVKKKPHVTLWGSGKPLREYLFIDDLVEIIEYFIENDSQKSYINVGSSFEISIKELAIIIKNHVGYEGLIKWDKTKPDGTPRKFLETSTIRDIGIIPKTTIKEGIKKTYQSYLNNEYKKTF